MISYVMYKDEKEKLISIITYNEKDHTLEDIKNKITSYSGSAKPYLVMHPEIIQIIEYYENKSKESLKAHKRIKELEETLNTISDILDNLL